MKGRPESLALPALIPAGLANACLSAGRQTRWTDAGQSPVSADAPLNASERQELLELRRKLKHVQQERDILAKATARFAGECERTFTTSSRYMFTGYVSERDRP